MPAHVQNDDDSLLATFCHDDEADVEAVAGSGKEALKIARDMLAKCTELYHGDVVSVWRIPPAPSRGDRARARRRRPD